MTAPPDTNGGMADTAAPSPPATAPGLRDKAGAPVPGLRDEAERSLRSLAGDDARLREDQWTAISALLDGSRALVVQRTGWGKSAVYFIATALLRARARTDSHRVAPAGPDAQPDRRRRARRDPGPDHQFRQRRGLEQTYGEIAAGDVDVLLVGPERLNIPASATGYCPGWPGPPGCW